MFPKSISCCMADNFTLFYSRFANGAGQCTQIMRSQPTSLFLVGDQHGMGMGTWVASFITISHLNPLVNGAPCFVGICLGSMANDGPQRCSKCPGVISHQHRHLPVSNFQLFLQIIASYRQAIDLLCESLVNLFDHALLLVHQSLAFFSGFLCFLYVSDPLYECCLMVGNEMLQCLSAKIYLQFQKVSAFSIGCNHDPQEMGHTPLPST